MKRVIVALTLVVGLVACTSPQVQGGLHGTATPSAEGSPVHGTRGDDYLHAGVGDDDISGGGGDDQLFGGLGNDTIHSGIGHDVIFGGPGKVDVCYVSPKDLASGCEYLSVRTFFNQRTSFSTTSPCSPIMAVITSCRRKARSGSS